VVYKSAAVIIAAAALNVASIAAIPVDTSDNSIFAREPEPLFGLGAVAKIGGKLMHKVGHKKAKQGAEVASEAANAQQNSRRSLNSDEFDELFAREPEPLFGLGAVAKIGGKLMHKVGHKKAKHGAEAASEAANAQQNSRRSLDSDEFDELFARDFDELDELVARDEEFELEAREPEPLFGLGAVAKIGGKLMHKVGHKKAKQGAEAAGEAANAQQNSRRSLDSDELDELFARDFDELDELVARDEGFELEAREPEPLFGLGAVAKIGGKLMHKVGHKKAKQGAEVASEAANTQQTNRRSLEYGLDELD